MIMKHKNLFLSVIAFAAIAVVSACGSSSEPQDADNYTIYLDDEVDQTIYPSFVLGQIMNPNFDSEYFITAYINNPGAKVKLTIEANDLMEQCIEEHVMAESDSCFFYPVIKWKRDALLKAKQPGFINLSIILEVNGEVKNRFNKKVEYRSVNECILAINYNSSQGEQVESSQSDDEAAEGEEQEGEEEESSSDDGDMGFCCVMFVNEDNPQIDKILAEILSVDKSRQFIGEQGTDDDIINQMYWVWEYFANRDTRYSSITNTSNSNDGSRNVESQYIRTFNEVVNNNQANCIDGTCMLASIYRKIGLDVNIVLVPGHAYLAVGLSDGSVQPLETTMMGNEGDPQSVFEQALEQGNQEYNEAVEKGEADVYNVENCRQAGYKPLAE